MRLSRCAILSFCCTVASAISIPPIIIIVVYNVNVDAFLHHQQHHHKHQKRQENRKSKATKSGPTAPLPTLLLYSSAQSQQPGQQQSSSSSSSSRLSVDRTEKRRVNEFQNWAAGCGVQGENGFALIEDRVDGNEDWYAVTTTGAIQNSCVLRVPGQMILSANSIGQEYQPYISESSFQILQEKCFGNAIPQFYLFMKILVEYEAGQNSPYFPWLASLPRKWNTAVSMDHFCMSCLPPFLKLLCNEQRDQLAAFVEALQEFPYLSTEIKKNAELLKFAYNVAFTRSFPPTANSYTENDVEDLWIIPVADYLNHGYPENVILYYNSETGYCEICCKEDVEPGQPLTLCYGNPTNPSKLLAQYGFLNEEYTPATYCKLLFPSPSQELIEVGYDPDNMVFFTDTGAISQEVWDVMLYSLLEQHSFHPGAQDGDEIREAFYQAVVKGDDGTRCQIHKEYQSQTCTAMLRHVDKILTDVDQLTKMMLNFNDADKHPRLPLLLKHHQMVTSTFQKNRAYILDIYGQSMYG